MNNNIVVGIAVAVALAVVAGFLYMGGSQVEETANVADLGMYPYECDNGSAFILSPLEGLETVQVSADAQGMFTGTATLAQVAGTQYAGTAPDGQDVGLLGNGETIYLSVGSQKATCAPKANPDSAPWNWGDAS